MCMFCYYNLVFTCSGAPRVLHFFIRRRRQLCIRGRDSLVGLPCPLLRRSDSVNPCNWLNQVDWDGLPAGKPRLVIAHGSVQGFGAEDLDAPASANNRLRLDGAWLGAIDYIAPGDWHGLKQVSPKAWYSGTLEPDRFPRSPSYQAGQVLQVALRRGELPQPQPLATGSLGWPCPLSHSVAAAEYTGRISGPSLLFHNINILIFI